MNNQKIHSIFQLALMILRDECPPDNTMYLCKMQAHEDCECSRCWESYLYWAVNGYREQDRPYRCDKYKEVIENHGYNFYPEGYRF